jgi:hypothetical protein
MDHTPRKQPAIDKSLGNAFAVNHNHSIIPNYRLNGSDVTDSLLHKTPRSIFTSETFAVAMFTVDFAGELAGGYFGQR